MASVVAMQEPVCLVDNGPDGKMSVQQGALQILEQIQQPVVVVAVVGLYRTGKSYFMNRLAGKQTGFALGNTIESKTKGIWMWCVPHPKKPGHTLVLLDTEGLGDVEKGDEKHDTWIFCLAVLLSSTLVYNSMGTIDNNALEKLQYVTELTKHIQVKSSEHSQSTEMMRVFPSFVWTVRDFSLELELKGKPITADEYLENALKLKPDEKPEDRRFNQVRQGLRDFFAVRHCFVFERPANKKKMKMMEQLTDNDLEEGFVEEANKFCSYIFSGAQPKTMRGGLGVTGRMLGCLAETYVEAIRSGNVPCLESAVKSLALIQNGRAEAEALAHYQREMQRWVRLPSETQEALSKIHTQASTEAICIFTNASFNDQEQKHQLQLMTSVCEQFEQWCKANRVESRRVCERLLERLFAKLEHELRKKKESCSFRHAGGYQRLTDALQAGVCNYRKEKRKGLMSEEVLGEYLSKKEEMVRSILLASNSIEDAQKKLMDEQRLAEEEERRVRREEEELERREEERKTQEQSFKTHMEELLIKMEREHERAKEQQQRVIAAKLQEHKQATEEQSEERVRELERELEALCGEAHRQTETQRSALSVVMETFKNPVDFLLPGVGRLLR